MGVLHTGFLLQPAEELVIAEALVEVLVLPLDEATYQEYLP